MLTPDMRLAIPVCGLFGGTSTLQPMHRLFIHIGSMLLLWPNVPKL